MKKTTLILLVLLGLLVPAMAQDADKPAEKADPYTFTLVKEIPGTPVVSQGSTGTCWCFATISFLEAEVLRKTGKTVDLSEMYIVRHAYTAKADRYVRLHGTSNFSQGGQAHDVLDQVRVWGVVPESVYDGMKIGQDRHNHGELATVLTGMVDAVCKGRRPSPTPVWKEAFEAVADVYLGASPESVEFEGKTVTPQALAKDVLKINPDDYVEFASMPHKPYYTQALLDVPDNWSASLYYNVPMEDLEKIADYAIDKGYSIAWDGDVSEKHFSMNKEHGWALLPKEEVARITEPVEEVEPTEALRRETYDNFQSTDDHLMHLCGVAADQNGAKYYYIKNSWGTESKYDGYLYMSRPYFLIKTTAFLVHKDGVPKDIRKKLGIK